MHAATSSTAQNDPTKGIPMMMNTTLEQLRGLKLNGIVDADRKLTHL
jgi:hypothetical protein